MYGLYSGNKPYGDGVERDSGPLDLIFRLAGSGRGPAGQVRLWSAIVLVLFGGMTIAGAYMYAGNTVVELPAAAIEDGHRPRVHEWPRRSRNQPNPYQIGGHLAEADSVAFVRFGTRWRCAAIVSARDDDERTPRVYYAASETHYYRSRAEQRFVGELYYAPQSPVWGNDDLQRAVPYEAYLLFDDGTQPGSLAAARGLFIIGAAVSAIALIAFLVSLREQGEDAAAPPAPSPDVTDV
jgi:hypothetical protein